VPLDLQAHPENSPTLVNRYVNLTANGTKAEVSVALLYGDHPAFSVRRSADSNGDGSLSPIEIRYLTNAMQAQASQWLRLEHQGEPIAFAPSVSIDFGNNRQVAPAPFVVEARMTLALGGGSFHVFSLEPALEPVFLGETEVACTTGPGWTLDSSSTPVSTGQDRSYKLQGHPPPGWKSTFNLQPTRGPEPPKQRAKLSALVLAGLAVLALLIWYMARRGPRTAR